MARLAAGKGPDVVREKRMDFWSLAQYWLPALVALVAVVVFVRAARSRASKSATRQRPVTGSPVDLSYLDSSHIGEPQAGNPPSGHARFDLGQAAGSRSRRARR
jgi:hypothetical protein